ncbi:MAG: pyrroline-5-carboxylate reductase [Tepidiformaceae bacterium]
MRVALIGGGVMGEAILAAALERGVLSAENITVAEIYGPRREQLAHVYSVAVTADSIQATDGADLVILAVKPQDMHSVRGSLREETLLLSIMAGVPIRSISAEFQHERVVRVMPNLPAAANAGMSIWTATGSVSAEQRDLARELLGAIGREAYVEDESKLDMATAVSGSGPGYVYMFMEAMIEGAVAIGLPRTQAEDMVLQTVYGAVVYAQESGHKPGELRARVTSPAGTTAAGLFELEKSGMRAAMISCIKAAHQRAKELGEG